MSERIEPIAEAIRASVTGYMRKETAHAIALVAVRAASDWRPIEGAPRDVDFLAFIKNGYITRARYLNGAFFAADFLGPANTDSEPTHWMPLPNPPA